MGKAVSVVMIPFSAFSHPIPFFQLSIAIAKAGVHVLPKGAEATIDVPPEKIPYFWNACGLLQHPIKNFVAHQSADYIVADFVAEWAVDISRECHVPLFLFSVFSFAITVFVGPPEHCNDRELMRPSPESLTTPPQCVDFPSLVTYRHFEAIENYIGLLPPPQENIETLDESWVKIFQWLDEQKSKTVVFVCFGSECKLTRDQSHVIAYEVELSGLPFLWALRKPHFWASPDEEDVNVALPEGFTKRTSRDGSFSRQNIADSLQKAMSSEGQKLRDKAREFSSVFGDQKLRQDHYISEFVKYLKNETIKRE
ncbi:hypothetical protein SLA2020_502020 [Shorea laevis]